MAFEYKFNFDEMIYFEEEWSNAVDYLSQDLEQVVMDAGDAAIIEMQGNHPYQDRTYTLSGGMQCRLGKRSRYRAEAFVHFLAPYANIVNDGSVKSQPYPFVPQGEAAGQRRLEENMTDALNKFCLTLSRKR